MKTSLFCLLMVIYLESFGAIIFIKGQPVPLEYSQELYYLPVNFVISPETTNLYITMDGMEKVCFLDRAPVGLFEQISEINIIIQGIKTQWNCFPYETTILEVRS